MKLLILQYSAIAAFVLGSMVTDVDGLFKEVLEVAKDSLGFGENLAKMHASSGAKVEKIPEDERTLETGHYRIVDYSENGELPPVRLGGRVIDLVNGIHFDDLLQDMPDELRPPGVVAFFDSNDAECQKAYDEWGFDSLAENKLPARERLLVARYDMYSAPKRAWYKFTPEMDLAKRFGVKRCPELVFVPQTCNGFTEWCEESVEENGVKIMGCENFKDQCTGWSHWDHKTDMNDFIMGKIAEGTEPEISPFLKTYREQGEWIKSRDHTTTDNHMRNLYLSQAFPAYSADGYKPLEIPKEFQEWLLDFYTRNEKNRRTEYWDAASTQMSFHAVPTTFIDMDRERYMKEEMANKYLKPLLEEWTGVKPLELTSFYGQREYPNGSVLKNHVDRIDTHVLSVTLSIKKLDPEAADEKPWPLEVIRWDGRHVRYDHPGGTMIMYESSKLPHGRPYENQGGTHLGAFCHFKPADMHSTGAAKWESIVRKARKHQRVNSKPVQYRSTRSIEPENPVFSKVVYGDKTNWRGSNEERGGNGLNAGQFTVSFRNLADRTLDVYWKSPEGELVHQGTLGPRGSFDVNTYQGHVFVWTERGSETPLPGGSMTMDRGRTEYTYSLKK